MKVPGQEATEARHSLLKIRKNLMDQNWSDQVSETQSSSRRLSACVAFAEPIGTGLLRSKIAQSAKSQMHFSGKRESPHCPCGAHIASQTLTLIH